MGFVLKATGSNKKHLRVITISYFIFWQDYSGFMSKIDYSMQAFKDDVCIKTGEEQIYLNIFKS